MEYSKIIAVSGLPGLYELITSKNDGAIVRSLEDKSTRFVASRVHQFSHLESIEIYTVRDNVNLVDILKAMEASGEKLPDDKDDSALKKYFGKVYADIDFDRVYSSDLKKMVKWFTVLKKNDVEIKLTEPEPVPEAPVEKVKEAVVQKPKEEKAKPVKKTAKAEEPKEKAKAKAKPATKEAAKGKPKEKAKPAPKERTKEKPKKSPPKKK
jgi:hypothetical protein